MKQKTKAYLAIDKARDELNQGRQKIEATDLSSVIYLYEKEGVFYALAYQGRQRKAAWHLRFKTYEARRAKVITWMRSRQEMAGRRKPSERELAVGDVVYASWGYDQTNIDYYKVTKLVGNTSVELVEVAAKVSHQSSMTGVCIPDTESEVGERFVRRANGASVKIDSVRRASKLQYNDVHGAKIYDAKHFSSYH